MRVQRADMEKMAKPQEEAEAKKLLKRKQTGGRLGKGGSAATGPQGGAAKPVTGQPKSQKDFRNLLLKK